MYKRLEGRAFEATHDRLAREVAHLLYNRMGRLDTWSNYSREIRDAL